MIERPDHFRHSGREWFPIPVPRWITNLFRSLDQEQVDRVTQHLHEDCEFIFGNAPPVEGRAAVRETIRSFYDSIEGTRHDIHETYSTPKTAIVRGTVTYTESNGSTLTVPFVNVFELRSDRIATYQVYVDNHELSLDP